MDDIEKIHSVRLSSANDTSSTSDTGRHPSTSTHSSHPHHHDPTMAKMGTAHDDRVELVDPTDAGEARVAAIRNRSRVLRRLHAAETWFDRCFHYEAQGVERVPEDKRQPPQILNVSVSTFLPHFISLCVP